MTTSSNTHTKKITNHRINLRIGLPHWEIGHPNTMVIMINITIIHLDLPEVGFGGILEGDHHHTTITITGGGGTLHKNYRRDYIEREEIEEEGERKRDN